MTNDPNCHFVPTSAFTGLYGAGILVQDLHAVR